MNAYFFKLDMCHTAQSWRGVNMGPIKQACQEKLTSYQREDRAVQLNPRCQNDNVLLQRSYSTCIRRPGAGTSEEALEGRYPKSKRNTLAVDFVTSLYLFLFLLSLQKPREKTVGKNRTGNKVTKKKKTEVSCGLFFSLKVSRLQQGVGRANLGFIQNQA